MWWGKTATLVRHVLCAGFFVAALVCCQVYDSSLVLPGQTPEGGISGDAESDASDDRSVGPGHADGADEENGGGGGAGGQDSGNGGSAGQDVGTGGRDGSNDTFQRDADSGPSGRDADASIDVGLPRDAAGDSAPECGSGCVDAAIDVSDGIVDRCPDDPLKTEPGACGCGTPDSDSDMDGTADCIDGCPTDGRKTQPGICGCNAEDPADPEAGVAFCLKALLAHRYRFEGTGTAATDSIATAHGSIMGGANATLSGGAVSLTGDLGARYTNEGYVQLPSDLVSSLTNATFEAWVTWRGAGSNGSRMWQRIFDFGDQTSSGSDLVGRTYLFVTPHATSSALLRAAFSTNGAANETIVNAVHAFPLNAQTHIAVVVDDTGDSIALYLNGDPEGSVAWTGTLASISNVNSWLGRSNYAVDPELNGVLHEFRIFRVALTAAQVKASFLAGPDPAFF